MLRAKALGFNVLRFGASGFWPGDHALFVNMTTRPLYLAALDSVFEDAKTLGVQLIPSLQWNYWAFVDVCHESLGTDMMRTCAASTTTPFLCQLSLVQDHHHRHARQHVSTSADLHTR